MKPMQMKIIHIDRKRKCGLVKSDKMKKSLIVTLQDWLIDSIKLYDYVTIKKSAVTGELIVIDYTINLDVYSSIHNDYQTNYENMVCDERGNLL